jgi:hypothetical protein
MTYRLSILVEGTWLGVAEFEAQNPADAYRQISKVLPPEHAHPSGISIQSVGHPSPSGGECDSDLNSPWQCD